MEDKNVIKISLSTLFLIFAIIAIIIMGIFLFMLYNKNIEETQKSIELQTQVNSLKNTVNYLEGKINSEDNEINQTTNNNIIEEDITNQITNSIEKYKGESFVGYYQLLKEEYFSISKYDSTKYTTLDLEIQLLENGTAKVAYRLDDNGNISSNQYNANYTVEKIEGMEINGDEYRSVKLTYISDDAKKDSVISAISTDITYNPASSPSDGTQAFEKSLIMRGGAGNLIPYMVKSSEVKFLK